VPGAQPELDRGSYLSTYGLLNPWTLWLLAHEPELVSLRPSELHQASVAPRCPDPLCKRPMQMRDYGGDTYRANVGRQDAHLQLQQEQVALMREAVRYMAALVDTQRDLPCIGADAPE